MKALLGILCLSSGLVACQKDNSIEEVNAIVNKPFALFSKQAALLPTSGGGTVRVVLATVNDWRCPKNANCLLPGYATVTIELTDADPTPQKVSISLGYPVDPAAIRDSVLVTLNQRAYWLRLLAIDPYPMVPATTAPKIFNTSMAQVATLRLRLR